jgi:hypothetical protein
MVKRGNISARCADQKLILYRVAPAGYAPHRTLSVSLMTYRSFAIPRKRCTEQGVKTAKTSQIPACLLLLSGQESHHRKREN